MNQRGSRLGFLLFALSINPAAALGAPSSEVSDRLHHPVGEMAHAAGSWEVKQISGADYATVFWRKVINQRAHRNLVEARHEDPYWVLVTRLRFPI